MKATLKLVGKILTTIGLASFIILEIVGIILVYTNSDYNFSSYTGFRVPNWPFLVTSALAIVGMLLWNYAKMKNKTLLRILLFKFINIRQWKRTRKSSFMSERKMGLQSNAITDCYRLPFLK